MAKRVPAPFDVSSFMEQGDQFHYATVIFRKGDNQQFAMVATPFVACSAFSLEVYLKVLANIERKLLPLKTHNLRDLFFDISPETQLRLSDEWSAKHLPDLIRHSANPHLPPGFPKIENFRQALELSADAFVDWRYATRGQNRSFHLPDLVPLARRVIIEKRPDIGLKYPRVTRLSDRALTKQV